MNNIGWSFFVCLTQRVSTSSTAASAHALRLNRSASAPLAPNASRSNRVIFTTSTPAEAIIAIEQGRRP